MIGRVFAGLFALIGALLVGLLGLAFAAFVVGLLYPALNENTGDDCIALVKLGIERGGINPLGLPYRRGALADAGEAMRLHVRRTVSETIPPDFICAGAYIVMKLGG